MPRGVRGCAGSELSSNAPNKEQRHSKVAFRHSVVSGIAEKKVFLEITPSQRATARPISRRTRRSFKSTEIPELSQQNDHPGRLSSEADVHETHHRALDIRCRSGLRPATSRTRVRGRLREVHRSLG